MGLVYDALIQGKNLEHIFANLSAATLPSMLECTGTCTRTIELGCPRLLSDYLHFFTRPDVVIRNVRDRIQAPRSSELSRDKLVESLRMVNISA